jgi:hypothetical protein
MASVPPELVVAAKLGFVGYAPANRSGFMENDNTCQHVGPAISDSSGLPRKIALCTASKCRAGGNEMIVCVSRERVDSARLLDCSA